MKFTDDPYVKETLMFLMTREVAHFQMFEAALETITPNFPPGALQADPRYSNTYFNMSSGSIARGPWNQGISPELQETWQYIEDPIAHVESTLGLTNLEASGTERTEKEVEQLSKELAKERSREVSVATPEGKNQWSKYTLSGEVSEGNGSGKNH
jgi:Mn-containing catalase